MPTSLPVVAFTLPVFFSPRTLLVSRRHAGLILPPAIAGEVQSPRLAHFDRSSTPDVLPFPSFHPRFACHGPRLLHLQDDAHHLLLLRFVVLDQMFCNLQVVSRYHAEATNFGLVNLVRRGDPQLRISLSFESESLRTQCISHGPIKSRATGPCVRMPWLVGLDEYSALSSFEGMLLQDFLGLFSPYRFPRKSSASSRKCVGSPPQAAFGFHRALCCHCRSAHSSHTYGVSSGRTPSLPQKTPEPRHAATCYCTAPSVPPEPHPSRLHSPVHARLFRLFHRSWAGCFGNLLRRQRSVWGVQLVLILQLMLHMRWNPYIDTTLNKAPCPRSARKCAPPSHPSAPHPAP